MRVGEAGWRRCARVAIAVACAVPPLPVAASPAALATYRTLLKPIAQTLAQAHVAVRCGLHDERWYADLRAASLAGIAQDRDLRRLRAQMTSAEQAFADQIPDSDATYREFVFTSDGLPAACARLEAIQP